MNHYPWTLTEFHHHGLGDLLLEDFVPTTSGRDEIAPILHHLIYGFLVFVGINFKRQA
jgi:hypothetical protein